MLQLDKLMGMHAAATGKSKVDLMDGFDASDAMGMCQIAKEHGISIPPSVMKKMYAPFVLICIMLMPIASAV